MKLDILIVDAALVAAVFLPYFLFILIGQREERKIKNKFSQEAKKHQLQFDEKEKWNNNIIGLDRSKLKVLFVQKRKAGLVAEIFDLRDVRSCEILKVVRTMKIELRTEDILERLDLKLLLHNGNEQLVNLYNCEETYAQDFELKHSEKWNSIITSCIILRPKLTSAA